MRYRPAEGSTDRARELRSNSTDAEIALWRLLRESFPEARFRRQVPIRHFITDFASHRERLVIEIDGGQHEVTADAGRTELIEAEGYRVIRFCNNEVLGNPEGGWTIIDSALRTGLPHPQRPAGGSLTPSRERES
jgi:very-short-patch-repair endonuclease